MNKLKILYDGHCYVCHKEIQHYLKLDAKHGRLVGVDISLPRFNAEDYCLTAEQVNLELYSIDEDANVFKGIDTFIEIWKRVSPYNKLTFIFTNKLTRPGFDAAYYIFAHYIRKWLPKRKCAHGQCDFNGPWHKK